MKVVEVMGEPTFAKWLALWAKNPWVHYVTNKDSMYFELTQYTESLKQDCVSLRTRNQQEMLPWITPSKSNLINKLKTQKNAFRKSRCIPNEGISKLISKLENVVLENCEIVRLKYQKDPCSSEKFQVIELSLRNKLYSQSSVQRYWDQPSGKRKKSLFNELFHSVYSPPKKS